VGKAYLGIGVRRSYGQDVTDRLFVSQLMELTIFSRKTYLIQELFRKTSCISQPEKSAPAPHCGQGTNPRAAHPGPPPDLLAVSEGHLNGVRPRRNLSLRAGEVRLFTPLIARPRPGERSGSGEQSGESAIELVIPYD
jgi:hypothetical protein